MLWFFQWLLRGVERVDNSNQDFVSHTRKLMEENLYDWERQGGKNRLLFDGQKRSSREG